MNHVERILKESNSFIILTNDESGFPSSQTFPLAFYRNSYINLKFYMDENMITIKNIRKNPKGSISCSSMNNIFLETLVLKGTFSISDVNELVHLTQRVEKFDQLLNYESPLVVTFETLLTEVNQVKNILKYIF